MTSKLKLVEISQSVSHTNLNFRDDLQFYCNSQTFRMRSQQNRRQKVFNRALCFCGGLETLKIDNPNWFIVFRVLIWGAKPPL